MTQRAKDKMKTIEDAEGILHLCIQGSHIVGSQLATEGIPCPDCCEYCDVPTMIIWAWPELKEEWEKMQEGK